MSTAGPRWRPTAIGMLVALLVLWALGLDLLHAVVLAATTLALMALRRSPAVNDGQEWPVEEGTRSDTGARREVSRLSWAMQGYESRVQRNSVARLHQIAAYRLGERGLDLEDPRDYLGCESALGARAYRVVSEPDNRPLYSDFVAAVSALEKLAPAAARAPGADLDPASARSAKSA